MDPLKTQGESSLDGFQCGWVRNSFSFLLTCFSFLPLSDIAFSWADDALHKAPAGSMWQKKHQRKNQCTEAVDSLYDCVF